MEQTEPECAPYICLNIFPSLTFQIIIEKSFPPEAASEVLSEVMHLIQSLWPCKSLKNFYSYQSHTFIILSDPPLTNKSHPTVHKAFTQSVCPSNVCSNLAGAYFENSLNDQIFIVLSSEALAKYFLFNYFKDITQSSCIFYVTPLKE